ncbi:hypothetical protein E2986_13282 [Frieseomelitta varia]|uniref:NADH dehydrogenase [ubiquinone] 1 alpha subcomplex subunit 12 n=1 Tax=Frieseomelitta varia TaxID=561572 RepID=A0A833S0U0_9HYME|nr:hypothetical protein E2986_13282 [Frieseomelitta varia]
MKLIFMCILCSHRKSLHIQNFHIIKIFNLNSYTYLKEISRNRWVIYSEKVYLDYDGSQVPAEWYGWLHYKTDLIPTKDPSRPKHKWIADHKPNLSGTNEAYIPYTTTKPKIIPWKPPQ